MRHAEKNNQWQQGVELILWDELDVNGRVRQQGIEV